MRQMPQHPLRYPMIQSHGCRSVKKSGTFNATLKREGQNPVKIGIGAHLGDVVLGEIGAMGQAPRTLIGDSVNTASRLDGVTKEHQVQAFISEPLLEAAGIFLPHDKMMELVLRGVIEPLRALPVFPDTDLGTYLENM